MVKRCPGTKVGGEWTGFQCVLDEGHPDRFCQPYIPPDVDEWRAREEFVSRLSRECTGAYWAQVNAESQRDRALRDRDRLQAELDALRAVVESGRDLDAEVLRAVQTQRDDLAGLARKGGA